ncbi:MAG TPA: DUF4350 domain-containing protein, partial [Pyrinomonadaceae bacterium]|nr:DUF4350 domain-containing protein [Pyrinomonadaceae bacterium]
MRQRFAIILVVGLVLALLVALNAASYIEIEQKPDSEYSPDRSTYNAGATGTRALYDFMRETGRDVTRWREPPAALLKNERGRPSTLVVLEVKVSFEPEEVESLMGWVKQGGRLVVIDRRPNPRLLPDSGDWRIATEIKQFPSPDAHADNPEEMTAGVSPARPTQPTALTLDVESVMPSRFAGLIHIWLPDNKKAEADARPQDPKRESDGEPAAPASPEDESAEDESIDESISEEPPPPPPPPMPTATPSPVNVALASPAPVSHLADNRGVLL